jgi:hypothetical protein
MPVMRRQVVSSKDHPVTAWSWTASMAVVEPSLDSPQSPEDPPSENQPHKTKGRVWDRWLDELGAMEVASDSASEDASEKNSARGTQPSETPAIIWCAIAFIGGAALAVYILFYS